MCTQINSISFLCISFRLFLDYNAPFSFNIIYILLFFLINFILATYSLLIYYHMSAFSLRALYFFWRNGIVILISKSFLKMLYFVQFEYIISLKFLKNNIHSRKLGFCLCIWSNGKLSLLPLSFGTLLMVLLNFFLLSMVPMYYWAFYNHNLLKLIHPKSLIFFLFILFFYSKHKRKLTVLNDFERKKF